MNRIKILAFLLSFSFVGYSQTQLEYFKSGKSKFELKNFQGALEDYNKAIELDSNNFEVYYKRGLSKDSLEDYDGAMADYNKAIALNLKDANLYHSRGSSKTPRRTWR